MLNYFPSPVAALSETELFCLRKEIEDSGVLEEDRYDWPEESWEAQAIDRYHKLHLEIRLRWESANPEEAEKLKRYGASLASLEETTLRYIQQSVNDSIFYSSPILSRLRS